MYRSYSVYMITNKHNSVFYIGITNNLSRRIYEHKNKLADGFSAKYNLGKLVYFEVHESPTEAIKREKQLKNLVRRKKIELIKKFNPEWKDLYKDIIW